MLATAVNLGAIVSATSRREARASERLDCGSYLLGTWNKSIGDDVDDFDPI
jgi:hypothetical protein